MGTTADALAQIDLFADLTKKERVEIERIMTPIRIKAGREFIKEGSVGREAFIILEGDATVWRHGRLVTHVGPGAFLGEMAVLAGTPRSATVRAETDMEVEVLARNEFSTLLDDMPSVARKLLVASIKRLHQLEPALLS
jgi:CRP-like cAMP-binding protein